VRTMQAEQQRKWKKRISSTYDFPLKCDLYWFREKQ
jgi:hypothetical protein